MNKFLITYYTAPEAMAQMATATEEQKAAGMQLWMDWKASVGDAVLDFGAPLMPGTAVDTSGGTSASGKDLTGYSILQAESMEAVQKMLASHPHHHWHDSATIEVHEMIAMG